MAHSYIKNLIFYVLIISAPMAYSSNQLCDLYIHLDCNEKHELLALEATLKKAAPRLTTEIKEKRLRNLFIEIENTEKNIALRLLPHADDSDAPLAVCSLATINLC